MAEEERAAQARRAEEQAAQVRKAEKRAAQVRKAEKRAEQARIAKEPALEAKKQPFLEAIGHDPHDAMKYIRFGDFLVKEAGLEDDLKNIDPYEFWCTHYINSLRGRAWANSNQKFVRRLKAQMPS
jgi:archaellum component FlaD/FlaE